MELNRKMKPRYLGPYVVVRKIKAGSYVIAELNRSVSKIRVAAFHLIPYFPYSNLSVPITKLVNAADDELENDANPLIKPEEDDVSDAQSESENLNP
ncbi:hypothetical protein A7U60_g1292 [Sanghuangporus baumii]|uniref:Uncharacterized protein n=1 Tax=Sanghuangporus baumii TaxID=108892 RepID=A0A9Q5I5C8_SANBA|nr:hypothetical protein A7U60_g1292 [Sanghuangporus baumii]